MSTPWLAALVVGMLAACSAERGSARLPLEPCEDDRLAGKQALCGKLTVFEDRASSVGRTIDLNVAVIPARAQQPRPDPLVVLVGGPGQSATRSGLPMASALWEVQRYRDIVLVDQRGTGKSNPLRCASEDASIEEMLDVELDEARLKKCLAELDADTRLYTTDLAMDDLGDVVDALGYEKVNLWGGSYGTRAALVYMRRHPRTVRRVVLDGPAPTDIKLTVHAGRDAQRALDAMFERCAAEPACHARFPDVRETFARLLERLRATPEAVEFRHPTTGEMQEIEMSADVFAALVRGILYVPLLVSTLPYALERAAARDWAPLFAAFLFVQSNVSDHFADGMFLSVVCAEDVPRITAAERVRLSANFLGDRPVDLLTKTCALWPAATMPAEYFAPIVTDHPTLVLTGEGDPVTPPFWGDVVAKRLPNARHVTIPKAAHGVSALKCVSDAIAEFLDADAPLQVEVDCDDASSAPIVLGPAGPAP